MIRETDHNALDPMQRTGRNAAEADGGMAPRTMSAPRPTAPPPPPPPQPVTQATQGTAAPYAKGTPPTSRPGWPTPPPPPPAPVGPPPSPATPPMSLPPGVAMAPPGSTVTDYAPAAPAPPTVPTAMPGAMPTGAQLPGAGTVNDHVARISTIDPANDLRNKVIAPENDPVLDRSRQAMSDAQTQLAGFDRVAGLAGAMNQFGTGAGERATRFGGQVDAAATGLANIDRMAQAQELLSQWEDETAPMFERDIRSTTQNNAAMGRLGSGMLRTDFGNLALARGRDRQLMGRKFMSDALNESVNDQFRKTDALSALEQRARANFESDRGFASDLTDRVSGDRARALEAARAVFGTINDEATGRRNELRGERDYQVGQEQAAFDRALQQYLTEHGVEGDRFQRAMQLLAAGEAGNPANVLAGLQAAGIDPNLIAQLTASLGSGTRAPTGTTSTTASAGRMT